MTLSNIPLRIGNRWLGQSGLNYYDNTARLLDPILGDFKSGDPQFTKYPSMSHYSFCGANFANAIAPNGQDIFLFDKRGYHKNKKEVNSLSTSHDENKEKSLNDVISNYFGNAQLRTFYHNHPNGSSKPLGYSTDNRYGDISIQNDGQKI